METNKLKYCLLLILTLFCTSIFAQNKDSLLYQQQRELTEQAKADLQSAEDEIAKQKKELAANKKTIDSLKRVVLKAQNDLKAAKGDSKAANTKAELQKLKAENEKLKEEKSKAAAAKAKAVEDAKKQKDAEIINLKQQVADLKSKNTALNTQISKFGAFKTEFFKQMNDDVEKEWLPKPFSTIDSAKLVIKCNEYAIYQNEPQLKAAKPKMEHLLNDFNTYKRGIKALNSPYVVSEIDAIKMQIRALRDNTPAEHSEKKDELSDLAYCLNNYSSLLKSAQKHITKIDGYIDSQSKVLINTYLNGAEVQKDISDFKDIPWLDKTFAEYKKQLENNINSGKYIKNTPPHDAIMTLIP